jgi:hypothetical protein
MPDPIRVVRTPHSPVLGAASCASTVGPRPRTARLHLGSPPPPGVLCTVPSESLVGPNLAWIGSDPLPAWTVRVRGRLAQPRSAGAWPAHLLQGAPCPPATSSPRRHLGTWRPRMQGPSWSLLGVRAAAALMPPIAAAALMPPIARRGDNRRRARCCLCPDTPGRLSAGPLLHITLRSTGGQTWRPDWGVAPSADPPGDSRRVRVSDVPTGHRAVASVGTLGARAWAAPRCVRAAPAGAPGRGAPDGARHRRAPRPVRPVMARPPRSSGSRKHLERVTPGPPAERRIEKGSLLYFAPRSWLEAMHYVHNKQRTFLPSNYNRHRRALPTGTRKGRPCLVSRHGGGVMCYLGFPAIGGAPAPAEQHAAEVRPLPCQPGPSRIRWMMLCFAAPWPGGSDSRGCVPVLGAPSAPVASGGHVRPCTCIRVGQVRGVARAAPAGAGSRIAAYNRRASRAG